MSDRSVREDHEQIADLIPWYVNGTIGDIERQRVDSHVLACSACRDDLSLELLIREGMTAKAPVEYMPAASLKRLHAAIDRLGAESVAAAPPVERRQSRRPMLWRGAAAASVVLAAAIALTTAGIELGGRASPPAYHTVTTSAPRPPDEAIRAVFSPTITLVDLQGILDEAQLRIISGPTEAGVYSLAATSQRSVSSSLALLRRHADVRFAESTGSADAAGPRASSESGDASPESARRSRESP